MPTPHFVHIGTDHHGAAHDSLVRLDAEYLAWVRSELAKRFPALATEGGALPRPGGDADMLKALYTSHPPGNVLYLIEIDGDAAGMCGLRGLGRDTAEIKRLYVRPAYRGMRLGSSALRRLVADACQRGYARVCLDTADFMTAAHRLYEAHGFTDCAAYEGTEVPAALHRQWRFMQRAISMPCP